jgi:hypothetical protein
MKKLYLLVALVATSCASPLQQPAERVVDNVLPEYIKYVEADSKISEAAKQRRKRAIQSFIEAVDSGR